MPFLAWIFLLFALFPASAFTQSKNVPCYQVQIKSFYSTKSGESQYQDLVGSVIRWQPNGKIYVVTVAHGVVHASQVIVTCGTQKINATVLGADVDRDTALLELPMNGLSIAPMFNLPQGDQMAARKSALAKLVRPNTYQNRMSDYYLHPSEEDPNPYHHLSIIHPFFKNELEIGKVLEFDDFKWTNAIEKDFGIFQFQTSARSISQHIFNKKFADLMQNPFYSFEPLYLRVGVRPGMSGAAVFEYVDLDLSRQNNPFVGLVSKTLSYKNLTLLVPATIVTEAIHGILNPDKSTKPKEWSGYQYDSERGQLYPFFTSNQLGLSFRNACDADYATSSSLFKEEQSTPLRRGQGGDWGDGGGSRRDFSSYIFTPYFIDSRHVPAVSCMQSGVVDNERKNYIAYKSKDGIQPLRNLDQFVNFKKEYENHSWRTRLVGLDRLDEVKEEICKGQKYTRWQQQTSVKFDFIEKYSLDKITKPEHFGAKFRQQASGKSLLGCAKGENFKLLYYRSHEASKKGPAYIELSDLGGTSAELKIQLNSCELKIPGKGFGFEYFFKDTKMDAHFYWENPARWVLNIGRIAPECQVKGSSIQSPAMRLEFIPLVLSDAFIEQITPVYEGL